jgi:hypothetical protein
MRKWKYLLIIAAVIAVSYGSSRLYYAITDGFTIGNISSEFTYNPRWETAPLSASAQVEVESILKQKFTYLGKGCQSYVFLSADQNYVMKFFKYQRFTPQAWLDYFAFIPAVDTYRLGKIEKKRNKREALFQSCKLSFDELQSETGLVFIHLNKTNHLNTHLTIVDKMGFEHVLDLDKMEFFIQRKVDTYQKYMEKLILENKIDEAKDLLTKTVSIIISEYKRGLADNDHAWLQNSGVSNNNPVHIDVGQFVRNEDVKKPEVYKQELFSKTFRLREWLRKKSPELEKHLETEVRAVIGDGFDSYKPVFIPHSQK